MDNPHTKADTVEKQCTVCGAIKPFGQFTRNEKCSSGREGRCKACATAYKREWRKHGAERKNERERLAASGRKACSTCGIEKSIEAFCKAAITKDGREHRCRTCMSDKNHKWYYANLERELLRSKNGNLRAKYGITLSEYQVLWERQGGLCAICHRECQTGRRLAVDHDHDTGAIRGLLCSKCNGGLGLFNDNLELVIAAVAYLGGDRPR